MSKFPHAHIFAVAGVGFLDKVIRLVQNTWNTRQSETSHVGIVCGEQFYETAAWGFLNLRTGSSNPRQKYAGSKLKMWSFVWITPRIHQEALRLTMQKVHGQFYPFWRLLAFIPGFQGWLHGKRMNCSNMSAYYIMRAYDLANGKRPVWPSDMSRNHWEYDSADVGELCEKLCGKPTFNNTLRNAGLIP